MTDQPDPPPAAADGPDPHGPISTAEAADRKGRLEPLPRCAHGMYDVIRSDGRHCCPACRRNLPADRPPVAAQRPAYPAGTRDPDPPPGAARTPAQAEPGRARPAATVLPFRPRHRPRKETA
jgi:hypothetical protein